MGKKVTTSDFTIKASIKHHGKYDYSRSKIEIECPDHGYYLEIASDHLFGQGCKLCGWHTTNSFIKRANEIHHYKYDYSLVEHINNSTKVKIICKIHGDFNQLFQIIYSAQVM